MDNNQNENPKLNYGKIIISIIVITILLVAIKKLIFERPKVSNYSNYNLSTYDNTSTIPTLGYCKSYGCLEKEKYSGAGYCSTHDNTTTLEYCNAYGCIKKELYSGAKYCSTHLNDSTASTPKSNSSSHKCEYYGCSNYAIDKQYCSIHTKKSKCVKSGCSNSEAYAGAGYCTYHIAARMK